MQIDIADAVLDDIWNACAIPGDETSTLASWLDFVIPASPSSPPASAKDARPAKGNLSLDVLSLRIGSDDDMWRWT